MHPIPMMATGTGDERSDEFKSLPFRTSLEADREPWDSMAPEVRDNRGMLG